MTPSKFKISMILTAEEFMTIFPRIGAGVQLEIKKIDPAPAEADTTYQPPGIRRRGRRTKAEMEAALASAAE